MASFAEVKANAAYFLARKIGERLIPPIPLHIRQASLESAREWDGKQGNFKESAIDYYSIFSSTQQAEEKAEALIGLSQELINLGQFRQARRFLDQGRFIVQSHQSELWGIRGRSIVLPQDKWSYYCARIYEKFGWIADYELGYYDEIECFSKARSILNEIPKASWRDEEYGLFSTTTHFLGRAHYGLASQGITKEDNISKAIGFFREDLSNFSILREQGNPAPANEGFQHAWLVRCYLSLGELSVAEEHLERCGGLFREYLLTSPRGDIMAHYYVLRGSIDLEKGLIDNARSQFQEALKIRTEAGNYPKGLSDAAAGIALTYWKEKKPISAIQYFARAVKAHPFTLLRGILGG